MVAPWPADRVEKRPLASLRPFDRNARQHSDAQVAEVARSIETWGWTMPVLVDESDEIIAGHARVLAARLLKLEAVPVIVARGWTDAQRRAYVIADNKLALNASWDDALLRLEVADLRDAGFDIGLTGFSPGDLATLFLDKADGETDADREWTGMPEYDQPDKTAFRTIPVHFKSAEDVERFAELIGQKITDATRFVWFPEIVIERYVDKAYVADDAA